MDAKDMTDVLHYFFEEDLELPSAEMAEAKSEVRKIVYESLYGLTYKYAYKSSDSSRVYANGSGTQSDGYVGSDNLEPFDPSPMTRKAYVPPTEFNPDSPMPFGKTLDAPLG